MENREQKEGTPSPEVPPKPAKDEKPPKPTDAEVMEEARENEPPLLMPSVKLGSFSLGRGMLQTIVISFVMAFIALMLMGAIGGGSFVTKKDFTVNLTNMSNTMSQMAETIKTLQAEIEALKSE